MGLHSDILGNLPHRHHKLALTSFFRKRQDSSNQNLLVVFMFYANLVSTFSKAIYRLIRMGHESISVLTLSFKN